MSAATVVTMQSISSVETAKGLYALIDTLCNTVDDCTAFKVLALKMYAVTNGFLPENPEPYLLDINDLVLAYPSQEEINANYE